MRLAERLIWALLIVVVDVAAFAVPLAALLIAYVLLARPAWFREREGGYTTRHRGRRAPGKIEVLTWGEPCAQDEVGTFTPS